MTKPFFLQLTHKRFHSLLKLFIYWLALEHALLSIAQHNPCLGNTS